MVDMCKDELGISRDRSTVYSTGNANKKLSYEKCKNITTPFYSRF